MTRNDARPDHRRHLLRDSYLLLHLAGVAIVMSRSHSTWFHFTKEPKYFAAVDEIREPQLDPTRRGPDSGSKRRLEAGANAGFGLAGNFDREYNPLGKLPGSVWTLDTRACLERIIKGWSPSGICVECGEGRRPVVERDWSKLPQVTAERQFLSPKESAEWASVFQGWMKGKGVSIRQIDELFPSRNGKVPSRAHNWATATQNRRPSSQQLDVMARTFGPFPQRIYELMESKHLVRVVDMQVASGDMVIGRHRARKRKQLDHGEYLSRVGYACACPEPTAPTTDPQVLISGFDAFPLVMTA